MLEIAVSIRNLLRCARAGLTLTVSPKAEPALAWMLDFRESPRFERYQLKGSLALLPLLPRFATQKGLFIAIGGGLLVYYKAKCEYCPLAGLSSS
jgi:hypothetical protein